MSVRDGGRASIVLFAHHNLNHLRLTSSAMGCVARRLRIGGAIPLGCALAALWAAPASAESGTRLFTPRRVRAQRRCPARRRRRREELGRRRLRQAALGQRRRFPRSARSSATSTWSGSRNSPGRCRRDRRRLAPGRRAHRGRAQPGLSDLPPDARRASSRCLGPRRPDVAAGQPRA